MMKEKLAGTEQEEPKSEEAAGYLELDSEQSEGPGKYVVRPFMIEDFEDIKTILDSLREGSTIALINIKPLKDKDIIELKRAINKLKKTCEAVNGEIAGFGDDYIVATPGFARIYRAPKEAPKPQVSEKNQAFSSIEE